MANNVNWKYPGGDPENGPAYNPDARDRWGNLIYDADGNPTYHRKDGREYRPQRRREKRDERHTEKMLRWSGIDAARDDGIFAQYSGMKFRNPFPPGKRHDAFKDGYQNAFAEGGWE